MTFVWSPQPQLEGQGELFNNKKKVFFYYRDCQHGMRGKNNGKKDG